MSRRGKNSRHALLHMTEDSIPDRSARGNLHVSPDLFLLPRNNKDALPAT